MNDVVAITKAAAKRNHILRVGKDNICSGGSTARNEQHGINRGAGRRETGGCDGGISWSCLVDNPPACAGSVTLQCQFVRPSRDIPDRWTARYYTPNEQ